MKKLKIDRNYDVHKLHRYFFRVIETKYTRSQKVEYRKVRYCLQWKLIQADLARFIGNPFGVAPRLAYSLVTLLIVLFAEKKDMGLFAFIGAITEDSKTASATDINTTFSVVVGNNADRMMIFGMGHYQGDAGLSGVTYAGAALTIIKDQAGSFNERAQVWGKVAPATGTNNLVVSGAGDWTGFGVLSAYNVDQTLPATFGGSSGDSSNASSSLTTTVANAWVVAAFGAEAVLTKTTTGGIEVMNEEGQSFQHAEMHYVSKATAGSQAMSCSLSYGSRWNVATCQLKPVAASGPANLKTKNALAKASIKTMTNLSIASVKTVDGLN